MVPSGAKLIYWTAAGWNPGAGITDANNFCNTHHPAGASGTFVALLATTTSAASAVLAPTVEYWEPNGVRVGLGSEIAANHGWDGIFVRDDLSYAGGEVRTWTGSSSVSLASSSMLASCNNWTSNLASGGGNSGEILIAGGLGNWFSALANGACSSAQPLFCVQQ